MSPTLFISISLITVGICTLFNNAQHENIRQLITFLQTTVNDTLIRNNEYVYQRELLITIKMLQTWINESQNYGLLNVAAIIVLIIALCLFDNKQHLSSYIILFLDGFILSTNILHLPRAILRLKFAITTNKKYLQLINKITTDKQHDTTNTSRS